MKINKSKTYLLPLLSEFVRFKRKFYKGILNTYILETSNKYKNCIFILYKVDNFSAKFNKHEYMFTDNELFVELIDKKNYVIYIFKFPEAYMKEYSLFKQGKYSKYSKYAKELILRFFSYIYKDNLNAINFILTIKQILFRNKKLKIKIEKRLKVKLTEDAELFDITNLSEETLNISEQLDKTLKKELNNKLFDNKVENI